MKKNEPDPIAQQVFDEKQKKKIEEDKKYEAERQRNLNAMTPEQKEERRKMMNEKMLLTIKGF